ncbi:MAG: hypothetical protein ACPL3B_05905 [Fervidobacterium sp.]
MSASIETFEPILEVENWAFHFPEHATHLTQEELETGFNSIWPTGATLTVDTRPEGNVYILMLEYYADTPDRILDAWYNLYLYLVDNISVWKTYPGKLTLHYYDSAGELQTIEESSPRADLEEAVAELLEEAGKKFEETVRCVICGDVATEYVGNEPMCKDCAEEYRETLETVGMKPYDIPYVERVK